jgi:hypothetical protein
LGTDKDQDLPNPVCVTERDVKAKHSRGVGHRNVVAAWRCNLDELAKTAEIVTDDSVVTLALDDR